jgi:hypothetical protein
MEILKIIFLLIEKLKKYNIINNNETKSNEI